MGQTLRKDRAFTLAWHLRPLYPAHTLVVPKLGCTSELPGNFKTYRFLEP